MNTPRVLWPTLVVLVVAVPWLLQYFLILTGLVTVAAVAFCYFIIYVKSDKIPKPPKATQLKPLNFTHQSWSEHLMLREQERATKPPTLQIESKQLQLKIQELIGLVLRDFVDVWYKEISKEPTFVVKLQDVINHSIHELQRRLKHIDFTSLFVSRVMPFVTLHIKECRNAELKVKSNKALTNYEVNEQELSTHYFQGKLHHAIHSTQSYLRGIVDKILPLVLPDHEVGSLCLRYLTREILVNRVLMPVLEMLEDPDYWNQNFNLLSDTIITNYNLVPLLHHQNLSSETEEDISRKKTFEEFMKMIKRSDSLWELLQIRDEIAALIERRKSEIAGCKDSDIINGVRVSDTKFHISRLLIAKRRADKRLTLLGGTYRQLTNLIPSLGSLLQNPLYLPHFTDFMASTRRSRLLSFWLLVDDFRIKFKVSEDNLVPIIGDDDDLDDLMNFLEGMWESYFMPTSPSTDSMSTSQHINISTDVGESTRAAIENLVSSCRQARSKLPVTPWAIPDIKPILNAQAIIFRTMLKDDYPAFLKSPQFAQCTVSMVYSRGGSISLPKRKKGKVKELNMGVKLNSLDENDATSNSPESNAQTKESSNSSMPKPQKRFPFTLRKKRSLPYYVHSKPHQRRTLGTSSAATHLPVRTDQNDAERVEEELQAILASEENAFSNDNRKNMMAVNGEMEDGFDGTESEEEMNGENDGEGETEQEDGPEQSLEEDEEEDYNLSLLPPSSRVLVLNETIERLREALSETEGDEVEMVKKEIKKLVDKRRAIEKEELENVIVSGRTNIKITDTLMSYSEESSKDFTVYIIEVVNQPKTSEEAETSGWMVARRYSEFHELHQQLKRLFGGLMAHVELPGKKPKGLMKLKKDLMEKRRLALEKYLQDCLKLPQVCASEEFRSFLCQPHTYSTSSQSNNAPTSLQSPTSPVSPLSPKSHSRRGDKASIPQFGSRLSKDEKSSNSTAVPDTTTMAPESLVSSSSEGNQSIPFSSRVPAEISATDVIVDVLMDLFEWKERSSYWTWLRRQAMLTVLTQVFGQRAERQMDEFIKWLLCEDMLLYYLSTLKESIWPNGQLATEEIIRTPEQRANERKEVLNKIMTLLPELFGSIIGKSNAKRGAVTLIHAFQSRLLNKHMCLILLDEIVKVLFPELADKI